MLKCICSIVLCFTISGCTSNKFSHEKGVSDNNTTDATFSITKSGDIIKLYPKANEDLKHHLPIKQQHYISKQVRA